MVEDVIDTLQRRGELDNTYIFFSSDNGYHLGKTTVLILDIINPCPAEHPAFANSVHPDQLASEEANWSGSALFAIRYVNL